MKEENKKENKKNEKEEIRWGWKKGDWEKEEKKDELKEIIKGEFKDKVGIIMKKGEVKYLKIEYEGMGEGYEMEGIVKDEGEEKDVKNGEKII